MKFIDINSLPKNFDNPGRVKFYVDLQNISVVKVSQKDDDWHVLINTAVGFIGLKCSDEAEANEIALKLISMIEEIRALPIKAHAATASDMVDKLKTL